MTADLQIFDKAFQIALNNYNASATTPISKDTAHRALVVALQGLITANVAQAGTITNPL